MFLMGNARQHHVSGGAGPLPKPLGYLSDLLQKAGLPPIQLDFGKAAPLLRPARRGLRSRSKFLRPDLDRRLSGDLVDEVEHPSGIGASSSGMTSIDTLGSAFTLRLKTFLSRTGE